MRTRTVALLVALLLLAAGCGDDGGGDAPDTQTTTGPPVTTPTTPDTVAGPSEGAAACAQLARRYVARARVLFETEGTPSDELVDETRARLEEFDEIAGAAGCGTEYLTGVCEGFDELTAEGVLVLLPLTTAQCL